MRDSYQSKRELIVEKVRPENMREALNHAVKREQFQKHLVIAAPRAQELAELG